MAETNEHPSSALYSGYPSLKSTLTYDECVYYAVQQNSVPVIKNLTLLNPTPDRYEDITVEISSDPQFCMPFKTVISAVDPYKEYRLSEIDLKLSADFLAALREKTTGHLTIRAMSNNQLILNEKHNIELLAYDEWPGTRSLPIMLAAFVMPNHPSIESILKDASKILKDWTQDSSISGYQTESRKRAWLTIAAIYTALQKVDISYINPPASFETTGQKIRTPDRILENKLGTCLDLTLLLSSCIEAAGLNPLITIMEGHAFPGAWLVNDAFSPATIDDLQTLRKRMELGEIVLFESTSLTSDVKRDFNNAISDVAQKIIDDDSFIVSIDISGARKNRIHPIPLRSYGLDRKLSESTESIKASTTAAPQVPESILNEVSVHTDENQGCTSRLDMWKSRLLDLSLQNRLLNFRATKKTVPILCPDLPSLEDALSAGQTFTFFPKPELMSEKDPRNPSVHQQRTGEDAVNNFLTSELQRKHLYADIPENELNKRLLETFRAARTAQEEGGANICYLALGFLEWRQSDNAERAYLAPLLLLPVELIRKSIKDGFKLQEHDDEPRVNVTLLQMLESDFNLKIPQLDPLPRDHSGIDVPEVFRIFRTAIRDIKGWEVKESVHLGLFSFTKYLMWKDLEDRTDDLMKNRVVEHLIKNPEEKFPAESDLPTPDNIDDNLPPNRMYCPLDADSSQLASVLSASNGQSFVMEGPPGTGKSQTITNMIAQCLAEGKTVLFVAEKQAALNVVYTRLTNIGLAPYCLELHSNKTKKSDVLMQLAQSVPAINQDAESEWLAIGNDLELLRKGLNQYVRILHKTFPNGLTAFKATATLIALSEYPTVNLRWASVDEHTREKYLELSSLVDNLVTTGKACTQISDNPWAGFKVSQWSPSWEQKIESQILELEKSITTLQESLNAISPRIGIAADSHTINSLCNINHLCEVLQRSPGAPKSLLEASDWNDLQQHFIKLTSIGRQRNQQREKVFPEYLPEILSINTQDLQNVYESANRAWWPISWFRRSNVINTLKKLHRSGKNEKSSQIPNVLSDIADLQQLQQQISAAENTEGAILGRYWCGGEGNWDEIDTVVKWIQEYRESIFSYCNGDTSIVSQMYRQLCDLITLANDQLTAGGQIGTELSVYSQRYLNFVSARNALIDSGNIDDIMVWGEPTNPDIITRTKVLISQWKTSLHLLRRWCAWQNYRAEAVSLGLLPLIDAVESGDIDIEILTFCFKKSYCRWWLNLLTDNEPDLRQFLRDVHENKIRRFSKSDRFFMEKTKDVLTSRLSSKRPRLSAISSGSSSETGLLNRELQKKKRHMPVRTLLGKIPNLLPRLKPCLLMSPLSVAQYLDPKQQAFDLVIFDEASQIPVWDAVGAIARGKQVIITGDPKQLPPTNFFMKSQEDDDLLDENSTVVDLESILDECLGGGLPLMRLNWHYRSRHESLIAFSNYHYYNNSLYTFPSAVTNDNAVSFHHVKNGIYDKGKSRTNQEEARAVVHEVIRRLCDPTLSDKSIGIVTFSQAQQTLIEDMLENECLLHPEIDSFFNSDYYEPVFVKNLENVQGDERDVILFSICYGRDSNGKLSLNFGPMNRDGGERRLNVAVTRARHSVCVFSSITSDEIDLRRTQARGVNDLKNFLEYAQKGTSALTSQSIRDIDADFESPFEQQVHDALSERGWKIDLQVGCSGYRIDLGVIDNNKPGRYLAGIECDGANYHSGKSARDRDRLRQAVLEGLGWKIIRIWSTDWWIDKKEEVNRVDNMLKELQEKGELVQDDSSFNDIEIQSVENNELNRPTAEEAFSNKPEFTRNAQIPIYTIYKETVRYRNQDDFYEASYNNSIRLSITGIIEKEGPISKPLLIRRLASLWDFARAGNRIQERVVKLIPKNTTQTTKHNGQMWYWPESINIDTYAIYRIPAANESESRDIVDIAPEEIANAALSLLQSYISIDRFELARETARLFGYNRLAAQSKMHTEHSIGLLIRKNHATTDDQMIILNSDNSNGYIQPPVNITYPVQNEAESDVFDVSGTDLADIANKSLSGLTIQEFSALQKQLKTDQAIGDLFGVTRQAVHQMRKKLDIESSIANNPDRDRLIKVDFNSGISAADLTRKYNMSISQIYRILKE